MVIIPIFSGIYKLTNRNSFMKRLKLDDRTILNILQLLLEQKQKILNYSIIS